MAKKGDNISRRKDGRWEGRYVKRRENGRTYFGSVFAKTYREAKSKLAKARHEWNEGMAVIERDKTKLAVIAGKWLHESEAFLKESTIALYGNYLERYIYPVFAKTDMVNIDNENLSSFSTKLLGEGGTDGQGLSPKTVSEIIRIMMQLRKFALLRNIAVGYSSDCVDIKQKSAPLRVFDKPELKKLHDHLDGSEDRSHLGILLSLSTGLRLGELCALTWDYISLEEKKIVVRHTLQRVRNNSEDGAKTKVIITSPKSDCSVRTIPLPDKLCAAIAPTWEPGAYFLTGNTEKYMEPRTMQNHFQAVMKALGIENAHFHALRHTFATQCVEAGFDVKCLSVLLGHSTVSITMDRYVHPTLEWKRQNMEKVASFKL